MNRKMFIRVMIALLSISLIFSFVVSLDFHHLDSCHEENCHRCSFIHYAQSIIKLSFIILIYSFIFFNINSFLSVLREKKCVFLQKSLVFQKVQFNE